MKFTLLLLFLCFTTLFGGGCSPSRTDMMDSTVQVIAQVSGLVAGEEISGTLSGSGVIYQKGTDSLGQVHSRILTANHVLAHRRGEHYPLPIEIGLKINGLKVKGLKTDLDWVITKVEFLVRTHDERICRLVPLILGDDSNGDVATAEVDCDAGRVADISPKSPRRGDHVWITGHPLGVERAILTEGYSSGWLDGFELLSAPATHGNSGGPVWNDSGEVVGILDRAAEDHHNISLAAPPLAIQIRILQTEAEFPELLLHF